MEGVVGEDWGLAHATPQKPRPVILITQKVRDADNAVSPSKTEIPELNVQTTDSHA